MAGRTVATAVEFEISPLATKPYNSLSCSGFTLLSEKSRFSRFNLALSGPVIQFARLRASLLDCPENVESAYVDVVFVEVSE
jgi:hypothetical protein